MTREELNVFLSDEFILKDKKVFIWGTGNTAELYQNGLNRLVEAGDLSIFGYGDNNPAKIGTEYHGYRVYSAKEVTSIDNAVVLIVTPQRKISDVIMAQLDSLGIENYLLDKVIFSMHKKDILEVYDLLDNEKSKEVYAAIIHGRATNGNVDEKIYTTNQYFAIPAFMKRSPQEVFVECGGYVGDTIEQYLWQRIGAFNKIISLEPDKNNYKAMMKRKERLVGEWNLKDEDIEILPYGVGEKDSTVYVTEYEDNHGLGSKLSSQESDSNVETKIYKLDSLIKNRVDFIKADIESYEYGMLKGAKETIEKYEPKMAICIYHNAADYFQIPLLIHEINPNYKLAVRQHSYVLDETVLYAWKE